MTVDGLSVILADSDLSVVQVKPVKLTSVWSLVKSKVWEKQVGDRKFSILSPDTRSVAFAWTMQPEAGAGVKNSGVTRMMVFETTTGKLLQQTDMPGSDEIQAIAFSPDGKLLAAGNNGQIDVWEVGNTKAAWHFAGHRGPVTSLAFSPDGKRLAFASEDTTVLVWDVAK